MSDAFRGKELARELDLTEYEAHLYGHVPPVEFDHPRLVELRTYIVNFDELVEECCEIIYLFAARERNGKLPDVNAWDHSMEHMKLQNIPWDHLEEAMPRATRERRRSKWHAKLHVMFLGVLSVLAKGDLRYWGVDDPTASRYCAGCRQPRAIEDFDGDSRTCEPCREYRRGNPNYNPKRTYKPRRKK